MVDVRRDGHGRGMALTGRLCVERGTWGYHIEIKMTLGSFPL